MLEELDYRAMRILPISVLTLLIIIPLLNISMFISMLVSSESGLRNIVVNGTLNVMYYAGEFLNITALIVSIVCLYRINGISRTFNYTWIIFVFAMITELLSRVADFFGSRYDGAIAAGIVLNIFYAVQLSIVAFGGVALVIGLTELSGIVNGTGEKKEREREVNSANRRVDALPQSAVALNILKKVWGVAEIVRISVVFVLYVLMYINKPAIITATWMLTGTVRIIVLMSILLTLVHVVISIMICVNMWKGFENYYIYKYNRTV